MAALLRTTKQLTPGFRYPRNLISSTIPKLAAQFCRRSIVTRPSSSSTSCGQASQTLPLTSHPFPQTYFDKTEHRWIGKSEIEDSKDPNKAKLGTTLRILQERLPTLLQSPLPQDILAPNISLQLFPTTHPHLPAVSGKVAYNAALWTSPIAWNRVPIIGNVKLEILAERMTSEPLTFLPRRAGAMPEQLVVRWCEERRTHDGHGLSGPGGIARTLWRGKGVDPNKAFTGLFIFDFDAEGRVLTHTIEQVQEGGDWEKGMGAKFVGLTDWLLGGMRNGNDNPIPMFERLEKPKTTTSTT